MTKELCVGIDIGNTTSSISYFDKDKQCPVLITIDNSTTVSSYVHFDENLYMDTIVGNCAKYHPDKARTIFGIKNMIGKKKGEIDITDFNRWPFSITESEKELPLIQMQFKDGANTVKEEISPEEILGILLHYLKARLMETVDGNIVQTAISVPPYFGETERKDFYIFRRAQY